MYIESQKIVVLVGPSTLVFMLSDAWFEWFLSVDENMCRPLIKRHTNRYQHEVTGNCYVCLG